MPAFLKRVALLLATGLGLGYLPAAPGTWASAVMSLACFWLLKLPVFLYLVVVLIILISGVITVPTAEAHWQAKTGRPWDNRPIVIDEWLGMTITLWPLYFFGVTWPWLIAGFILFRLFDIFKFGLAKIADSFHNQWGVMLDDLAAGLYAGLSLALIILLTKVL